MSTTQLEKGTRFRALHEGPAFIIPNPWDVGSARVLAALGFEALATTSSGFAYTLGRLDGAATLDEVIEHTRALDRATDLPVSVDLENGHGPEPEDAARAITHAADAGAAGGSIEDYDPESGLYGFDQAVERVAAACEAAGRLEFPFTLTARAENHIRGNPDLDDTIAPSATKASAPPTLTRCPPASTISLTDRPGWASTLSGLVTASDTARIWSPLARPGAYSTSAPARS